MSTPQKPMSFVGVRNGRPNFDFGDRAPTKAEREIAEKVRIEGEKAFLGGRQLARGEKVTP